MLADSSERHAPVSCRFFAFSWAPPTAILILCLAVGLSGSSGRAGEGGTAGRRPNIVLLLLDTVRADHCSAYGYGRDTTPTLERLAAEGAVFRHHLSPSGWTLPSIMTLFTGLSPVRHGLHDDRQFLPKGTPTIAAELKKLGYATLGVTCNMYTAGRLGFAEGFDSYDDYTLLLDYEMNLFATDWPPRRVHQTASSADLIAIAKKHLARVPEEQPFFLYLLLFDPHTDYTPPPEYAKRYDPDYDGWQTGYINELPEAYVFDDKRALEHVVALYDAEIRYTDDQVGLFLDALRASGRLTDDDIVIYTSDHGEEFNEHGGIRHRRTIHAETLHVPLVLHAPARLPPGAVVDAPTTHEDLFPTLAKALGWNIEAANFSPVDLFALARGEPTAARDGVGLRLIWEERDWDGWRTATHSLLRDHGAGRTLFYDLQDDPLEQHPLPPDAMMAAMEKALVAWRAAEEARSLALAPPAEMPVLSPRQREVLKSMGYVR